MKTYPTAETFEFEVEKLQRRADKTIERVNTFMTLKVKELHDALSEDQKERVRRRFQAKIIDQARKIVHPGSVRFN